ncbi:hypothetical protein JQC67_07305 [Aurantibacter crassamenti]|uniref:hypothetical protein n=1 Tax=Aurantibacter crassamenti TaxID=1837375 RepID=UPI00193ABBD3|nr:hypothetical protein [Aurantibacter crassamenti]MBM1105937.1 hypothetical protein [Aurantibacter crassamenti]
MRFFLKVISYIFHPLFIPIGGTLAYFLSTPKFSSPELQSANVLPIFILTVIIPIIFYLILLNIGLVSSIFIPSIKERIYPIAINIVLLLTIVLKVIPNNYIAELYYFFIGLIIASLTALLFVIMKFKVSMHLIGMGSLLMFLICLSIHFEMNITIAISLFTLATGLVTTSRLYLKAHTKPELFIGFFIGLIAQLLTVQFWL